MIRGSELEAEQLSSLEAKSIVLPGKKSLILGDKVSLAESTYGKLKLKNIVCN